MDLVRLGLERAKSAKEALQVITQLLEKYGQGGDCAENSSWSYHNSFLIADCNEAYVLETAGSLWAAEHVTSGPRNISNNVSIRTKCDLTSKDLLSHALKKGYWDGKKTFNFSEAFSESYREPTQNWNPYDREDVIRHLLTQWDTKEDDTACLKRAIAILREHTSGVCMHTPVFISTASIVSRLDRDPLKSVHWFTGTANPCKSCFKPLQFNEHVVLPTSLVASKTVDPNTLWWAHQNSKKKKTEELMKLENEYIELALNTIKSQQTPFGTLLFCNVLEQEWQILHEFQ